MNTIKAACGHDVPAVGAPNSQARLSAERSGCDACESECSAELGLSRYIAHVAANADDIPRLQTEIAHLVATRHMMTPERWIKENNSLEHWDGLGVFILFASLRRLREQGVDPADISAGDVWTAYKCSVCDAGDIGFLRSDGIWRCCEHYCQD
jgi:hypothetical protein